VHQGGFFVVLAGAVEVIDRSGDTPRRILSHHAHKALTSDARRERMSMSPVNCPASCHAIELVRHFGLELDELPAVAIGDRPLLRRPSPRALVEAVGLRRPARAETYDLVVVGAGPAGLAASVYGPSEGLRTLVLDSVAPGGQAGERRRSKTTWASRRAFQARS
jgi:hypothetical protein